MKNKHLLFVLVLFINSIYAQNRNEFTVADSAIYSSFAIDKNELIHFSWIHRNNRQIYYNVMGKDGNVIVTPKKNEKSFFCYDSKIVTKNEKKIITWTQGEGFDPTGNSWIWGQQTNLYVDSPKTTIQYNSEFYDSQRSGAFPVFINDTTYYVLWSGAGPRYSSAIWGQKQTTNFTWLGDNVVFSDSNDLNLVQEHHMSSLLNIPNQNKYCVFWKDNREKNDNIYGRFFDYQDRPLTSSFRINDKKGSGQNIYYYSAKISSKNEIVIAWCNKIEQSWHIFLKKIDSDGNTIIPSKQITVKEDNICDYTTVDLSIDENSNVAVAWEAVNNDQFTRIVIRGFDKNFYKIGEVNNMLSDSVCAYYFLHQIQFYNNNLYLMWSNFTKPGGSLKMWIIPSNLITSVQNEQPSHYQYKDNSYISISSIYPNPFNYSTSISFSVAQTTMIKIRVFDILGREAFVLTDKVYNAGRHQVIFDASNLPSGVYFCNLIGGSDSIIMKMLLVK